MYNVHLRSTYLLKPACDYVIMWLCDSVYCVLPSSTFIHTYFYTSIFTETMCPLYPLHILGKWDIYLYIISLYFLNMYCTWCTYCTVLYCTDILLLFYKYKFYILHRCTIVSYYTMKCTMYCLLYYCTYFSAVLLPATAPAPGCGTGGGEPRRLETKLLRPKVRGPWSLVN